MKTTFIDGHWFAELNNEQKHFIETVPIGDFVISEEHVEKVKKVLNLEKITSEGDLRAIRNSVVKHLDKKFEEYQDDIDIKLAKRFLTNISGITHVIDNELFKRGFEV